MSETQVVLVNEQDQIIGTMEKMEAHRKGLLHRAFSIFIFNHKGEMLLQQRASSKYHSGNLWTNACCSHPFPDENIQDAAYRRLQEEMGFVTPLEHAFSFTYKAELDNGLTEHEYDHVFMGCYDGLIQPNPAEVKDYCFMKMDTINEQVNDYPDKYTAWFRIAFPQLENYMMQKKTTFIPV
jgi:isopentenyl-diphosphate delta-isomerase